MATVTLPSERGAIASFGDALHLFLRDRRVRGCTAATIRFYHERIQPFVTWTEQNHAQDTPASATTDLLREFLLYLEDHGTSPATRNATLRALKAFFGSLEGEGYIANSPARRIPKIRQPKKLLRVLSRDELIRLLSQPDVSTDTGKRDAALLLLLADTGARVSEVLTARIASITWADQHRPNGLKVMGKDREERLLPFGDACRRALLDCLRLRGEELDAGEWMFPSSRNSERPLSVVQAQKICVRHSRAAGINPPIRPHVLRRTYATLLRRNGAGELVIQAALGHSTLDMTRRYCQIADEDLQETHRRYGVVESLLGDASAPKRVRLPGQGRKVH